ncbi:MAG TPA: M48 family metallopeptidase [Bacteroidales bacterium]|nr:M48 family metallopeptidase [Bacteroidales bacterium]HOK97960.1 M48 family metallopeptidase [Bacteroidales bacterium]
MNTILLLVYIIIIFNFLLERILSWLNSSKRLRVIPDELKDVYDEEAFAKSVAYKQQYERLGFFTSVISLVAIVLMLHFEGFAYVDALCRTVTSHPILIALLFFAILGLASDVLGIPFEVYATFVIEEKFGFNRSTPRLFITDKLKEYLLGALIGGLLLAAFIWFYYRVGEWFWIYLWFIYAAFTIFMSMFYSHLIVPLFNKQTPLPEGELRQAIMQLADKAGFKVKDIYVMDGSKRSTKANAYFTGLGKYKRIVLYDTLISQLSTDEIVAVLAHEIGHYKYRHNYKGLVLSLLQMGLTLYILSLFINSPALTEALGVHTQAVHISLLVFGILYSPISLLAGLLGNIVSRKHEYQADGFVTQFGLAEPLISALKKLSRNNLSNINPHPAYVFFHYSHPTLLQRIRSLKNNR